MSSGHCIRIFAQFLVSPTAFAFACSSAVTADEVAICSVHALMRQEQELTDLYSRLRDLPSFEEIQIDQRAWLNERRQCSDDTACIGYRYTERIDDLKFEIRLTGPFVPSGCGYAGFEFEFAICGHPELAYLSRQLSDYYFRLSVYGDFSDQMRAFRHWTWELRDCEPNRLGRANVGCLKSGLAFLLPLPQPINGMLTHEQYLNCCSALG